MCGISYPLPKRGNISSSALECPETGFPILIIDKKGYLITNYHVLKGSYAADVKTYDGKEYPIELVVAENIPSDLIKVWVNIPDSSIQWIPVTGTEPSIADRVVVVGSPMGLEQTVSEGIVSAVRELPVFGIFDKAKVKEKSEILIRASKLGAELEKYL